MSISPQGQPMTLDERVEDILRRYPEGSPVYRAIERARPALRESVERTRQRLDGRSGQPM